MSTPTSVYRYLDAEGRLIYVGITNRGMLRQNEHNTHARWWRYVVSQEVEHYDDRETAARRERYLIERHRPPFNTQHNAHLSLQAVVDGQFANDTGCVSIAPPGVEQSRRDLEANIAEHGIAALVEKASTDPWMVP